MTIDGMPQAGARRTILVVEDEALIRFALVDFLEDAGFDVIEAGTADQAMSLLEDEAVAIDLVFSDVQMPGRLSGLDLKAWARERRPELPVLLTSGYNEQAGRAMAEQIPILPKPYDYPDVAARIARAFATGPRGCG